MPRDNIPAEGTYRRRISPEWELWASVVYQTLLDATGRARPGDRNTGSMLTVVDQDRARDWLLRGGDDFREICEMAGMEPWCVRDRARTLASRGWVRDATLRALNGARGAR